jgi:hypothetical protein
VSLDTHVDCSSLLMQREKLKSNGQNLVKNELYYSSGSSTT